MKLTQIFHPRIVIFTAFLSLSLNILPANAQIFSDDFHMSTLDTGIWTFVNSLGDVTLTMTGDEVSFAIPGPTTHAMGEDSPTGNHAARIIQSAPDTDFEVEVKFASALDAKYQTQGIVVEQDSGTYLRLEFFSDGFSTYAYASSIAGGGESYKIYKKLSAGAPAPLYMRVNRTGNTWTQSYSLDGTTWTVAGTFSHALTVSAVGPYAGNIGLYGNPAPGHTGVIDYFFNTATPIVPEDGSEYTLTVTSVGNGIIQKLPDQVTYIAGTTVELTAVPDTGWTFANWSGDASGSQPPLTITMTTDQSITATFTSTQQSPTASFTTTPTTGAAPLLVNVDATAPSDPEGPIVSYAWDFGDSSTGTGVTTSHTYATAATYVITLTVTDEAGATGTTTSSVTVITGPSITTHPTNQSVTEGLTAIFSVVAGGTAPLAYQWQKDGGDIAGATSASYTTLATTLADDGATFLCVVSNSGGSAASNSATLTVVPGQQEPPTASFTTTPTTGAAPLLVSVDATASSDPDGTIVSYGWDFGDSSTGTGVTTSHTYATANTYVITLTVTDDVGATGTTTSTVIVTTPGSSLILSDDFHTSTLDTGIWTFVNSLGDVTLTMTGNEVSFAIPGPTSHAMGVDSPTGNHAARIMQSAPDTDFEVEVKFASALDAQYQTQGIVVEQDSGTYLRLEFFSNGSNTYVYASSIAGGGESYKIYKKLSAGAPAPLYMRVNRTGNTWTQSYSLDGTTWTVAGTFSQALTVSAVGPYAGNVGLNGNPAPAHTGVIDYFFNTATPIVPEDGSEYTLTVTSVGNGTIQKLPDQVTYLEGTTVDLTAVPDPSLAFANWSGDASGSQNPITITMTADQSITATFTSTQQPTASFTTIPTTGPAPLLVSVDATASSDPDGTIVSYAWDFGDSSTGTGVTTSHAYATANTYVITLTVTDDGGATSTTTSTVTVITAPSITTHPTNQTVTEGLTATFSVVANGTGPLAYQWQKNGSDIAGATNASYTTPATTPADDGATFLCVVSNSGGSATSNSATLTVVPGSGGGPTIDLWNGTDQTFGQLGNPQRWINILGNVSDPDGMGSLTYSLNGGVEQILHIGPDTARLEHLGNFNVEIDYADLVDGFNQVVITAIDNLNNTTMQTVTVEYVAGNVWAETYAIDWSTVQNIEDVAQIVDGKWILEAEGIRPEETGYDRIVTIGDLLWDDYEITVPVTIHGIDWDQGWLPLGTNPGFGVILRWGGHAVWCCDWQPNIGYFPFGAAGWVTYHKGADKGEYGMLGLGGENGLNGFTPPLDPANPRLYYNIRYYLKIRVETIAGNPGGYYKLKVWEEGQPEPSGWSHEGAEGAGDLTQGSLLLVAHDVDVEFGDVTIVPLGP